MRAVALEQPGIAKIIDVPKPEPQAGEVLLRVEMVGLCGTDLNSFRGLNPLISYPRVIGHEISATVLEESATLAPGTRVTISPYTHCGECSSCRDRRPNACKRNQTFGVQRDGALTEWISVPEERVYPSKLSLKELCIVEPLTVGFHAVSRGRVTSADIVAVIGCGGVGLGAVAGSAFRGARTIAVDVDDEKLRTAASVGATDLIHSSRESMHDRLKEITGGVGPNVVIEAIGLPETFAAAVDEVAFAGRVVYIGYAKHPVAYDTRLFVQKELDILGSRNALPRDFQDVIGMLESGRFPVEEAVSCVIEMEQVPEMLKRWSDSPAAFKKIMVNVRS
jgi:threonine dehydrogenase-like Zn-dependent dehydrogenase